jgi:hypothetical protein
VDGGTPVAVALGQPQLGQEPVVGELFLPHNGDSRFKEVGRFREAA